MPPPASPAAAVELVPASYVERLDLAAVFGRTAPVEVDVGCGDGSFLMESARRRLGGDFLGLERLLGRVRKCCRKAARLGLGNVRLLRLESGYVVRWLLPPGSVAVFHVLFPDPWPKRRHQRRRLVNAEFLAALHAALAPGGEVRFKTDDADYFAHIQAVAAAHPGFASAPWTPEPDEALTDFERGFRAHGQEIHRLRLRKV